MRATHALLAKVNFESFDDPAQAKLQYESYKRILQECDLEIIEIDLGPKLVLEDLLVVCNEVVIIPSMETQKRENLVTLMTHIKEILMELCQTVITMSDSGALFRGSDFLFTGYEIFVGITSKTNIKGGTEIANIFADYPCTMFELSNYVALKRHVTMAGNNVICVSTHPDGQNILKRIKMRSEYPYTVLTVQNQEATNCMFVNGTLIHKGIEDVPDDFHTICRKIKYPRRSACFWALATQNINLTSNCILFAKKRAVVKTKQV